jgi:hypothetical protein
VSSPDWDAPYPGPPQHRPHYGGTPPQQQWGPPPYAPPGYPPPGWGWMPYQPQRPQRPGSVIGAAVLAFASTLLVLVGTVYAMAFGALLSLARGPDHGIGSWVAVAQLVLAALLVVGGIRALGRDRRWLLGAAAGQLAMSLYWVVVLDDIAPSTFSGSVLVLPLLYGALAVVAGGLLFLPDARVWTARRPGPPNAGG